MTYTDIIDRSDILQKITFTKAMRLPTSMVLLTHVHWPCYWIYSVYTCIYFYTLKLHEKLLKDIFIVKSH